MNGAPTSAEMRAIQDVLGMGDGYVLDFTDRSFRAFFVEHGVDIDADQFRHEGNSKAKRLRSFLNQTPPPLSGQILAALLQHRELCAQPQAVLPHVLELYRSVVERLGGRAPKTPSATSPPTKSEKELLAGQFRPDALVGLPLDVGLAEILTARMVEAQRCIDGEAYLAAVVVAGSVLEGLCLGIGLHDAARVNRAFQARYKRPAPPFQDWTLINWIAVLEDLRDLSPNISKFGHALREFRNYVHPSAQLAARFTPDVHTARISFHVVVAAIDDLNRVHGGRT